MKVGIRAMNPVAGNCLPGLRSASLSTHLQESGYV